MRIKLIKINENKMNKNKYKNKMNKNKYENKMDKNKT